MHGALAVCSICHMQTAVVRGLFQGAAVAFQRTNNSVARGEIGKVRGNGRYDVIRTVDSKRLVRWNVPGTTHT